MALLGAHISVAGGLHHAFSRGEAIGCEALQIFVKNANRWQAKPLSEEGVALFRETHAASPELPVVAHASYLINLCATSPETLDKSRRALADELLRCSALGLQGLVVHPGAHLGEGERAGIASIARSLDAVFAAHPEISTRLLLENTAGQGTVLGSSFAQLAGIIEGVDEPERLGLCLDSCHAFAAGYDLRCEAGYEALWGELETTVGLRRLYCFHLNDSKHPLGSNKDRHESIGEGEIGLEAFARLVHDDRFAALPMILETPLGPDGLGHARDLERLRAL